MLHDQRVICDCVMISVLQTGHGALLSVTRGWEVNQIVTCIPSETLGLFQERNGKSPTVGMVLLHHMRVKDNKKSQAESPSFLQLRGAVSFYITVPGHMAREENSPTTALP